MLYGGDVVLGFAKHHLPNYGVFDEFRYFVPGETLPVLRLHGVDVAFAICEDLWQDGGRVPATRSARAGLLLSVNASPYERNKDDTRLELVRKRAQEAGCTTAYLAMTGGQDDLVFDGDSIVVDQGGEVVARAPQFAEECVVLDLDLRRPPPTRPHPARSSTTGCGSTASSCPRRRCPPTRRSGRGRGPSRSTTTRRCTPRWSRVFARTSGRTGSSPC
ncbi:nitrilase-related carbon-nitrogen hydrolase [Streptomyces sp. INA 01156]